jgi:hypothetical protein
MDILVKIGYCLNDDPPDRYALSDLMDELRKYKETKLKKESSEWKRIEYLISRLADVNNPDKPSDLEYNIGNSIRIIERILDTMDKRKWVEHHPGDTDEAEVAPESKEPEKTLPGGKRKKTRRAKKTRRRIGRVSRVSRVSRRGGRVDPKKEVQNAIDIASEKYRSIDRTTFARISLGRDISKALEKVKGAYEGDAIMLLAVQRAVDFVVSVEDLTQRQSGRDIMQSLSELIHWLEGFKMEVEG